MKVPRTGAGQGLSSPPDTAAGFPLDTVTSASDTGSMIGSVPVPSFGLDPLIAEAKRRARRRRLLVGCATLAVTCAVASLTFDPSSASSPAISQAGLGALVGTWSHHGALLVIGRSGRGRATLRTYSERYPGLSEVTFRVTSVRQTGRAIDAQIQVLHDSSGDTPAGMRGTLRLRRGVIYLSTPSFKPSVTFCSVKPGARWICGL